ncbi:MAG: hypothetical protein F4157_06975 [Synechococcus sp. SB0675_bin_6]|nr:hypothetical protein [Synechococcus sp. SB0675_bin_6]
MWGLLSQQLHGLQGQAFHFVREVIHLLLYLLLVFPQFVNPLSQGVNQPVLLIQQQPNTHQDHGWLGQQCQPFTESGGGIGQAGRLK